MTSKVHSSTTNSLRKKSKKLRYNLLIDEHLLEQLKQKSISCDSSVSSLIRVAVSQYLKSKELKK